MKENGVQPQQWRYVNPLQLNDRDFPVYDLVISFRSWCFHYPPETYQHFVNTHTCPGARIMLDVRKDRPWRKDLARMWHEVNARSKSTRSSIAFYSWSEGGHSENSFDRCRRLVVP
jgi:hypothetical protein